MFLSLFKNKIWRGTKKIVFSFTMGKTKFINFGAKKNINKTLFQTFLLAVVLWIKMKVFATKTKKVLNVKAIVIFWMGKLCHACPTFARVKGFWRKKCQTFLCQFQNFLSECCFLTCVGLKKIAQSLHPRLWTHQKSPIFKIQIRQKSLHPTLQYCTVQCTFLATFYHVDTYHFY